MPTESELDSFNKEANGRQLCRYCGRRSASGFVKGQGLCRYHWIVTTWGIKWADECLRKELTTTEE